MNVNVKKPCHNVVNVGTGCLLCPKFLYVLWFTVAIVFKSLNIVKYLKLCLLLNWRKYITKSGFVCK